MHNKLLDYFILCTALVFFYGKNEKYNLQKHLLRINEWCLLVQHLLPQ